MLLQHSRRDARVARGVRAAADGGDGGDEDGEGCDARLVLLPDQDRSRWHHDEIAEALRLLEEVLASGAAAADARTRELTLQAMIAAEHATATTAADTRWDRIAAIYAELEEVTGSAVVRLNRAVAVAEEQGPEAGPTLLEGLDTRLPGSHRLPATRAALLERVGRLDAAAAAYDQALERCANAAERRHLRAARDGLGG